MRYTNADARPSERALMRLWDQINVARRMHGERAAAELAEQALNAVTSPIAYRPSPSERIGLAIQDRLIQVQREHGEQAAITLGAQLLTLIGGMPEPKPEPKPAPQLRIVYRRPSYKVLWLELD